MDSRVFGTMPSGETVRAFTLSNASGTRAEVLSYGGILSSLLVRDREGSLADVVLGFDRLEPYLSSRAYFGAIIGRIAGRVSGGRLEFEGRACRLACNDGANHLHGGICGFDRRLWRPEVIFRGDRSDSLRLTYLSPDGEEGYPGNVGVEATYTLTPDNRLLFETRAWSDQVTPLSLTQHAYFNLAGEGSGSVLGHEVQILAQDYVPADASCTLSDLRTAVEGTGADLRRPRILREALPGIAGAHGDTYLLRARGTEAPAAPRLAARVWEPRRGRVVEVSTDEACLQFYTGVGLDGSHAGRSGIPYGPHAGLCLECEGYPNAAGLEGFGNILVRPGVPQMRSTAYAFSAA